PPRPDRSQRPTPAAEHARRGAATPPAAAGTPPAPRPTAGKPLGGVVEPWCAWPALSGRPGDGGTRRGRGSTPRGPGPLLRTWHDRLPPRRPAEATDRRRRHPAEPRRVRPGPAAPCAPSR